ncbi:MAG: ATP-binding cassette domain-containing protein [Candidatus Paceibacterota bacterium]
MSNNKESILKFDRVVFNHGHNKPILEEASFSIRRGAKIALMGQNGAGKSTIFKLITGALEPESGTVIKGSKLSIATAPQVIKKEQLNWTVREFFAHCFKEKVYDIDPKIAQILEVVNLQADPERLIKDFSGGQQARLLLASALIQKADILLLDEPTNNLDQAGIDHLTTLLVNYKKTCVVISHDANFLNAFTEGVLYLDIFTRTIEQYVGNYFNVVKEISVRVDKEKRKNAQMNKKIQANKDKANFFANKGGRMRLLAKRMREEASDLEENKVDVRREDATIRPFTIPCQENIVGELVNISSYTIMHAGQTKTKSAKISLRKNERLLLSGPNGIGKSTLLESIATGKAVGAHIGPDIKVGYYRQDFSNLDFDSTVYDTLLSVLKTHDEERLRSVAANFLINKNFIHSRIGDLSEGQKGLVALAQLVLLKPGLLILDEPTNHINFRHLPIIAQALDKFEGGMILVSHVPEFVSQIRIDNVLEL